MVEEFYTGFQNVEILPFEASFHAKILSMFSG